MEFVASPKDVTPYRPVRSYITPLNVDVIFWEKVNSDSAQWSTPPVYGTAHPNAVNWPTHKLVFVEESDEPGWQRWWYVADFQTQGLYNYEAELNLSTEWPKLTQTWIIPRAIYTGPGHTSGITAPPALGKTWRRMGDAEARIGQQTLDSLYVVLRIFYEDISLPLYRQRIDSGSGQIVNMEMRKVPAGTAGQTANTAGYIVEVAPINIQWSLSTKDRVSAMIGAGVRQYTIHRPFPWPPVLINFQLRLNIDLSIGYDYSLKTWDGECRIDVREYWSLTAPATGSPINIGKTSIRWNGALVNINIPECLHPFIQIKETGNNRVVWRNYPATPYTDWPSSQVIYPSINPHPNGGYMVTQWTVYSPQGIVG